MNDTTCKFPWSWVNVKVQNDQWRFCCKVKYTDHDSHISKLEEVRDSFLKQEMHQDCNSCWIPESKGYKSYRTAQGGKATHEQVVNFYNKKPSVEWIDVEFGDTCNMYCITCGPANSTLWQQIVNVYPNTNDKFDITWPRLVKLLDENLETIDHLNLYGGEPSLDANFYKIVDSLISYKLTKPIGVQIYTNGNYSDNHRVRFENAIRDLSAAGWDVRLHFSLDAIGEEVEFIRGGLNFKRFEKNLRTMIDSNLTPFVNVTISVLNIENHFKVYDWLLENNLADKVIPKFNSVSNPREFNISILGNKIEEFKTQYPKNLINDDWERFKKILENFLNVNSTSEPDRASIKRCVERLKLYSSEMPEYYKNFIQRLSML